MERQRWECVPASELRTCKWLNVNTVNPVLRSLRKQRRQLGARWLRARAALEMGSSSETHASPAARAPARDPRGHGRQRCPIGSHQEGAASSRGWHGATVSCHQGSRTEGPPTPPVASRVLPADSGRNTSLQPLLVTEDREVAGMGMVESVRTERTGRPGRRRLRGQVAHSCPRAAA